MISVKDIDVKHLARAVYAARNAMNSWDKSDSDIKNDVLGKNDLKLAQNLFDAGASHRKYLRQVAVIMDITAPLYWWKEADTYKIGTVSDSCSTMHKIAAKEFTFEDFSCEHLNERSMKALGEVIKNLNYNRDKFLETNDKQYWWQMIQLLPSTYNQLRTFSCSYENIANILDQRSNHKLDEWREFCNILKTLPYVEDIMCREKPMRAVCFHCMKPTVIWQNDFSFEDMGYEGDGIVNVCKCANCGADIEYAVRFDDEEDDGNET